MSTINYVTTTKDNDDDNTQMQDIYPTRYVNASRIPSSSVLKDKYVTQMRCLAQRNGTVSDTDKVLGRIWNADSGMTVVATATQEYSPSSITTSDSGTELTFDFSNIQLDTDYKIGIYWAGTGGDSSNNIVLRGYFPRTADNADVVECEYNDSQGWAEEDRYNLWQQITYSESSGSSGTRLPPPPLIARF